MTRALRLKLGALTFAIAFAIAGAAAAAVGPAAEADRPVKEVAMNCADCEPFGGPCLNGNCTGPWPW